MNLSPSDLVAWSALAVSLVSLYLTFRARRGDEQRVLEEKRTAALASVSQLISRVTHIKLLVDRWGTMGLFYGPNLTPVYSREELRAIKERCIVVLNLAENMMNKIKNEDVKSPHIMERYQGEIQMWSASLSQIEATITSATKGFGQQ